MLGVEPETLPCQNAYDMKKVFEEDGSWTWKGQGYATFLNAYLRKHHGLAYVEVHYPQELYMVLDIREPGFHLMTGRTVRTPLNGSRHVVIGHRGSLHWDPHPSRAGLTNDINFAFLVPYPDAWAKNPWRGQEQECVCPSCKP
jgi:hypothetical protein